MPEEGFEIRDRTLVKYHGGDSCVVIPDGVKSIGELAFGGCTGLISVVIPESVTAIGEKAFRGCVKLVSADIPSGVREIGEGAFMECRSLASVSLPEGLEYIGDGTFYQCKALASVRIPDGVRGIGESAFCGCDSLVSVTVPGSAGIIGSYAFCQCENLVSAVIQEGVKTIEGFAFAGCPRLVSVQVPASVNEILCEAFSHCAELTVVCPEESYTHHCCLEQNITFIFDYQFKAFHGVIPEGAEKLASPFLADEEMPYLFVSYSHRDREEVLPVLKTLYESGWRIWYDEGLTIGDKYDVTLKNHVMNCAAVLLFVTENSRESVYIRENELPWAVESGKSVIKCILEQGTDYEIPEGILAATVSPERIGETLEKMDGLTRGAPREAKGISVVVNPLDRSEPSGSKGFAFCLYSPGNVDAVRSILLEAKKSGCVVHEADGKDAFRMWLKYCACLIVFLDRAFLADETLAGILIDSYRAGRDLAVCQLEEIKDEDLPQELADLHRMQWLDFAHGITADMNAKLARHLEKRGCRDAAAMPLFEYEKTKKGIVIKKYTGTSPNPRIESEYGGIPVIGIAREAFVNNLYLKSVVIPDSVEKIGEKAFVNCRKLASAVIGSGVKVVGSSAFADCNCLTSVEIRDGVRDIRDYAFAGCRRLSSVRIPDSVKRIGNNVFRACTALTSATLPAGIRYVSHAMFLECKSLASFTVPDSVKEVGEEAFGGCTNLASVVISFGVERIGREAFRYCQGLVSVRIPGSVKEIRDGAFENCENLETAEIARGVRIIGERAFRNCRNLKKVMIPKSVKKIAADAFSNCEEVLVICPVGSFAAEYCKGRPWIRHQETAGCLEFWERFYGFLDRFAGFWKRLFGVKRKKQ